MKTRMGRYILDGHRPVPCEDLLAWGRWMEAFDNRRVALTIQEGVEVSTVFLGLDHGFDDDAPPALFETMTFINGDAGEQDRYSTWDEAEAGHAEMVRRTLSKRYKGGEA